MKPLEFALLLTAKLLRWSIRARLFLSTTIITMKPAMTPTPPSNTAIVKLSILSMGVSIPGKGTLRESDEKRTGLTRFVRV
jgi:hypothetical protein